MIIHLKGNIFCILNGSDIFSFKTLLKKVSLDNYIHNIKVRQRKGPVF